MPWCLCVFTSTYICFIENLKLFFKCYLERIGCTLKNMIVKMQVSDVLLNDQEHDQQVELKMNQLLNNIANRSFQYYFFSAIF
jgi:hypothetical protein